jgi:hypothetical protein
MMADDGLSPLAPPLTKLKIRVPGRTRLEREEKVSTFQAHHFFNICTTARARELKAYLLLLLPPMDFAI